MTLKQKLILSAITLLTLCSTLSISAQTIRGSNPQQFTNNLREAIANASSGDTITIASGNFELNAQITVDKPLTFNGAGRNTTVIAYSGNRLSRPGGLFLISARNVRFQNMRLRGSNNNTNRNIGNLIRAIRFGNDGDGCQGLRLTNVTVDRYTDTGVGHHNGFAFSGLIATDCIFIGSRQGINYINRKTNTGPGFVPTMARGEVRNCQFRNIRDNLVSIDCANDAETQITDFSNTLLIGNSMVGTSANPLSVTYISNLIFENNTAVAGRDAIHTEYRCRNLTCIGNTLSGRNGIRFGVGDSTVFVLRNGRDTRVTRDADVQDAHFNGTRDCILRDNILINTSQAGIELIECENIIVENNDLTGTDPSGEAKINLLAARGERFRRGCRDCVVRRNRGVATADVTVERPGPRSQNRE